MRLPRTSLAWFSALLLACGRDPERRGPAEAPWAQGASQAAETARAEAPPQRTELKTGPPPVPGDAQPELADGLVWIPGGRARLGGGDERFPERRGLEIELPGFWIEATEVTNRRFAEFVEATGFQTDAERFGDSVVFQPETGAWALVEGACWRRPSGAGSDWREIPEHPVVQVSLRDAAAYAAWAGRRLPSEAEWELAARGGLVEAPFVWGAEHLPAGSPPANVWQGLFPNEDQGLDGFRGSAPVGRFAPNGFGLFDLAGNVWEWVDTPRGSGPLAPLHEQRGPTTEAGLDAMIRGGSFLCAPNYCQGYRPSARQFKRPDEASNNLGFRCALSAR
jgi:formylglycine-generating enzyme required for sulfatase activity